MKYKGKYMAQTVGIAGVTSFYGNTIKQVLKKAHIVPERDKPREYGLFTVKDDNIVRIYVNGKNYSR